MSSLEGFSVLPCTHPSLNILLQSSGMYPREINAILQQHRIRSRSVSPPRDQAQVLTSITAADLRFVTDGPHPDAAVTLNADVAGHPVIRDHSVEVDSEACSCASVAIIVVKLTERQKQQQRDGISCRHSGRSLPHVGRDHVRVPRRSDEAPTNLIEKCTVRGRDTFCWQYLMPVAEYVFALRLMQYRRSHTR